MRERERCEKENKKEEKRVEFAEEICCEKKNKQEKQERTKR